MLLFTQQKNATCRDIYEVGPSGARGSRFGCLPLYPPAIERPWYTAAVATPEQKPVLNRLYRDVRTKLPIITVSLRAHNVSGSWFCAARHVCSVEFWWPFISPPLQCFDVTWHDDICVVALMWCRSRCGCCGH